MALRTTGNRHSAEDAEDLAGWVRALQGCPPITQTALALCRHPSHGDEPASWFYVEADAESGVARLRCLSGGHVTNLLDSAEQWTFPTAWACISCSQSIAEVVYGINDDAGTASWLAMVVRCVECGDVAGVTDVVLGKVPVDELLAAL
ncbi:MAG TPA: hypothetical protein VHV79_09360 [Mycobacteriales bacterium]|jgi:hypothetical protein|nr:hypothetical protein [Mycobacteriales bacterium]